MAARAEVFTVGYQGKTVESLLDVLRAAKVDTVVDVRELPLSRRRGFSKTPLRATLEGAGIAYVHLRDAGNPFRRLAADSVQKCLDLYRKHLARSPAVLEAVRAAITGKRAALLCVEPSADACHRGVIADELRNGGVLVRDL